MEGFSDGNVRILLINVLTTYTFVNLLACIVVVATIGYAAQSICVLLVVG